jgi:hypothetical protein
VEPRSAGGLWVLDPRLLPHSTQDGTTVLAWVGEFVNRYSLRRRWLNAVNFIANALMAWRDQQMHGAYEPAKKCLPCRGGKPHKAKGKSEN